MLGVREMITIDRSMVDAYLPMLDAVSRELRTQPAKGGSIAVADQLRNALANLRQTTVNVQNVHASEKQWVLSADEAALWLDSLLPLLEHIADLDNPAYVKASKQDALHAFIRASALLAVRDLSGVPESVIFDSRRAGAPALQEAADVANELSAHVRDARGARGLGRRRSKPRPASDGSMCCRS